VSFHETPDRELTKTQRLLKFKHASKKTHEEKLDDENSAAEDLMRQLKLATGSVDPSEITRRLRTSKQLNQSLRDQHKHNLLRSTQLKALLDAMSHEFSELRLGGMTTRGAAPAKASVESDSTTAPADKAGDARKDEGKGGGEDRSDNASRRIDSDLFRAEIRLNHSQRYYEENAVFVTEVSSGIMHVARLLEAYTTDAKRESGVVRLRLDPELVLDVERGEMPAHDPDANHVQRAGVVRLLTLCEETIVSVREALSIHKQIEDEDESSRPTTPKTPDFATGLGKKPSPKDRIQATLHNTLDSTQLVRSAHATAVPPVRVVTEKMREREIARDVRKREKKDREQNAIESRPVSRADEKSAATFVREGLDTQAVMDALRQANMLSKLKQGPRAPLGLAINQAIQSSSKSEQDKKSSVVVSKPHQLGISNPHLKITTRDMIKRRQPVSKNSPEPPGSADSS
jgi:hypothetical protein